MSFRYKGAVISPTPPTTTGGTSGTAPGSWVLPTQFQAQGASVWPTAIYKGVEDVFSTYLYTGNGTSQTITNGINLTTKSGLVWVKNRGNTGGTYNWTHDLTDTITGAGKYLQTNTNEPQYSSAQGINGFTGSGFSVGSDAAVNENNGPLASWTFQVSPRFFDIITWTGTGTSSRTFTHNLQSTPGVVILKSLDGGTEYTDSSWAFYVTGRPTSNSTCLFINTIGAWYNMQTNTGLSVVTSSTNLTFLGGGNNVYNRTGVKYIAYFFASGAGGYGQDGTDSIVKTGTFTANALGNAEVDIGFEPQWILFKSASTTGNWFIFDTVRGWSASTGDKFLNPNVPYAEGTEVGVGITPTATGFKGTNGVFTSNIEYVYIAIRRGPMKLPTSGTSIFVPNAYTGTGASQTTTTNFPVDLLFNKARNAANSWGITARLTGTGQYLSSNSTAAETAGGTTLPSFASNTGVTQTTSNAIFNAAGTTYIEEAFARCAQGIDVVNYVGTGVADQKVRHNLGALPQAIIVKNRTTVGYNWPAYSAANGYGPDFGGELNTTDPFYPSVFNNYWNNIYPTTTDFNISNDVNINLSGNEYVAWLFGNVEGVIKTSSFNSGFGGNIDVACGFPSGARFVLYRKINNSGDWYICDAARGMTAVASPTLTMNTNAIESSNYGVISIPGGFRINTGSNNVYMYIAIA